MVCLGCVAVLFVVVVVVVAVVVFVVLVFVVVVSVVVCGCGGGCGFGFCFVVSRLFGLGCLVCFVGSVLLFGWFVPLVLVCWVCWFCFCFLCCLLSWNIFISLYCLTPCCWRLRRRDVRDMLFNIFVV